MAGELVGLRSAGPTLHRPMSRCGRRGLATLELALSLPILLMVMALMVNFGTVASWKVRALGIAHDSLWGNRPLRSTANFPRPSCWPLTANMGLSSILPPTPPAEQGGALDGPRVTMLGPGGYVIPNTDDPATDLMNPTLQLLQGNSQLARQFPLLQKLGQYNLNAQTELLDNSWDFQRMGLGSYLTFRIPIVYTLAPGMNEAAWAQAYSNALWTIVGMIFPAYPNMAVPGPLWPLDRDVDFTFYRSLGFPVGPPDFHPFLANFVCGDDAVALAAVNNLIDRIQGNKPAVRDVAWNMAGAFIQLYQTVINNYQAVTGTPLPPQLQQQLQQNITTLQQFQATL